MKSDLVGRVEGLALAKLWNMDLTGLFGNLVADFSSRMGNNGAPCKTSIFGISRKQRPEATYSLPKSISQIQCFME